MKFLKWIFLILIAFYISEATAQVVVLVSLDGQIDGIEVEGNSFNYNPTSHYVNAGSVKKVGETPITRYPSSNQNAPNKIMLIGSTRVEYFPTSHPQFPGKVNKIGDVPVEHYPITNGPFSGRVKRIGNIEVECFPIRNVQFSGKLHKIVGADPRVKVRVAVGLKH